LCATTIQKLKRELFLINMYNVMLNDIKLYINIYLDGPLFKTNLMYFIIKKRYLAWCTR